MTRKGLKETVFVWLGATAGTGSNRGIAVVDQQKFRSVQKNQLLPANHNF
jgi:hypothetical protein